MSLNDCDASPFEVLKLDDDDNPAEDEKDEDLVVESRLMALVKVLL